MDGSSATILTIFVLFCRIGSALMVLPGMSAQQIPMRVRLMVSVACTLAISPLLLGDLEPLIREKSSSEHIVIIASEVMVGTMIGLMGRYFYIALEFFAAATSTFLGLGGTPGIPLHDSETNSLLGSLISMTAVCLIFTTDLHLEMIKALVESYKVIDLRVFFDVQSALRQLVSVAAKAFMVAVQLCGPFIIYSIVVNLLFGLANKLMPQLPIYFVSIPFVIFGGLAILLSGGSHVISVFMQSYSVWLRTGTP